MIRPLLALAVVVAALPAPLRAAEALFPETPLDCIVRPKAVIELSSEEEGVLTEILADRGQTVARDQVVARLESRMQQSALDLARIRAGNEAAIAASRARIAYRSDELDRMTELHGKRVASTAALDEAAVELRLAELELDSAIVEKRMAEADMAQAALRLELRQIRSPVDGVVVRVTAAPGEFAHEQAPVMTVAQLDPLHVEAYLPIALYPMVAMDQPAEVTIGAPIDARRQAVVSAIDRVFDAASGTFGVRLDLPNADLSLPAGLKCGLRFHHPAGDG